MANRYRIHRVKGCGKGLWDLEIVKRLPSSGSIAITGRLGESTAVRAELQALCDAANSAAAVLAALKAILPYAESRLEDMEECAEASRDCPYTGPEADAAMRKCRDAFMAAQALIAKAEGRA